MVQAPAQTQSSRLGIHRLPAQPAGRAIQPHISPRVEQKPEERRAEAAAAYAAAIVVTATAVVTAATVAEAATANVQCEQCSSAAWTAEAQRALRET